jgi:hypothetical protein
MNEVIGVHDESLAGLKPWRLIGRKSVEKAHFSVSRDCSFFDRRLLRIDNRKNGSSVLLCDFLCTSVRALVK